MSHVAFPSMQFLSIGDARLEGYLPAAHNRQLKTIDWHGNFLNSSLHAFWNSSAPLTAALLANNSLVGSLPETVGTLSQLTFLNLHENRLQGTVPLSWLQKGNMLSHVSFFNIGEIWDRSTASTSWRQQLCLQRDLYVVDVTGQQVALLPSLQQRVSTVTNSSSVGPSGLVAASDYTTWSQNFYSVTGLGLPVDNQLTSVRHICSNNEAHNILLAVWLVFGGCCLLVVLAYVCACAFARKDSSYRLTWVACPLWVWTAASRLYDAFKGSGGLVFYYYDLVTSIIVLYRFGVSGPGTSSPLFSSFILPSPA